MFRSPATRVQATERPLHYLGRRSRPDPRLEGAVAARIPDGGNKRGAALASVRRQWRCIPDARPLTKAPLSTADTHHPTLDDGGTCAIRPVGMPFAEPRGARVRAAVSRYFAGRRRAGDARCRARVRGERGSVRYDRWCSKCLSGSRRCEAYPHPSRSRTGRSSLVRF